MLGYINNSLLPCHLQTQLALWPQLLTRWRFRHQGICENPGSLTQLAKGAGGLQPTGTPLGHPCGGCGLHQPSGTPYTGFSVGVFPSLSHPSGGCGYSTPCYGHPPPTFMDETSASGPPLQPGNPPSHTHSPGGSTDIRNLPGNLGALTRSSKVAGGLQPSGTPLDHIAVAVGSNPQGPFHHHAGFSVMPFPNSVTQAMAVRAPTLITDFFVMSLCLLLLFCLHLNLFCN